MNEEKLIETINHHLRGVEHFSTGACDSCNECTWIDGGGYGDAQESESYFSFHACDSCGTTTAGNRYPAHGLCNEILHFDICEDCVIHHNNN